ncbi:MAG: hypothetical protein ABS76_36825 [Pelagibacterium sp. SCN 64-44]|jgi:hypothetical protein|nr:MAG: hypothetical protein ABS76_36825 [Pelagibacterium sp. SCN 64-44]
MTKYIHSGTSLGTINVATNGLEVPCTVSIVCRSARGPITTHNIEYLFVNMTRDHEAGMDALINGALAKGKALADAYIAAREAQAADATPMPDKNFSKRTTIFACGQPSGRDGTRREFEVCVEDRHDPDIRYLTLATRVGEPNESHLVLQGADLKGFLAAMAELQATPFSERPNYDEAA